MKNTSQITLISIFTTLIIISFNVNAYSVSDQVSVCNSALEKGDFTTATSVAAEILKHEANNRGALLCKGRALGSQSQASQANYNEALSALDLALKNSQAGLEQIITTIFIGNLHKKNNQNTEAIASYEKSLNMSRAEKNEKFERINLNFIGDTQTQNKDLNAAIQRVSSLP
jgi:tetratricopeptide (TPR) repeat protein